jgi:hypothetical protein
MGYRFITCDPTTYAGKRHNIIERVDEAVTSSFPHDIVAFDIGYNPDGWVVFEVNFAPALAEASLDAVTRILRHAV